jgi:N-acetylglucosamine-6-sulfatase
MAGRRKERRARSLAMTFPEDRPETGGREVKGSRPAFWMAGLGSCLVLAATLTVPFLTSLFNASAPVNAAEGSVGGRLNIVLILTDDQPYHEQQFLPLTDSLLGQNGVTFTNYFVSTALCCPSRATTLTGLHSHHHGVLTNIAPQGGAASFSDTSTIATWLQARGYRTGLFGKYLNQYDTLTPWPYVPPGWSRWFAFVKPWYYGFQIVDRTTIVTYPATPFTSTNYSTNVLAKAAVSFIEYTPPKQPLFLYFAPFGPHAPAIADVADEGKFDSLPPYRPPNFNEPNVSDKPTWVRRLPLMTESEIVTADTIYRNQAEALQSIDRAVASILGALKRTGRLSRTVIIYTSDNGYSLGSHRWIRKSCVYEECIRQPLIVRAPGVTPRVDTHLVENIDLAPTIAEFAGTVPASPVDGRSFVGLLHDPLAEWRSEILLELMAGDAWKQFSAVRTGEYLYVEYIKGDREFYDLRVDPFELHNAVGDPANAATVADLQARLAELKAN